MTTEWKTVCNDINTKLVSKEEYEKNKKYNDSPKKHFGSLREMVEKYYHYPVSEAAELLGAELGYRVDCRNLKRRLRDFGIERWSYEQLKHGPSRVRGASPTAVRAVADVTRHSSTHVW